MGDVAIRAEMLAKQYWLGEGQAEYTTLRDAIAGAAATSARALRSLFRPGPRGRPGRELIWALNDVSFEVNHGEIVGVIGRNGAGKSTLLKILSRITEPTRGFAEIRGRLGSLLEVGTGFHPELTGRENVYLNGAIMGMKRADIRHRFDEIIAFAGVERFLDTPVKHYSSGMHLRLAFAVAAHLEPEILLVDEVLAVGDAAFQRKCLGKIGDIASQGRTVLFISHNMPAVKGLCERAFLIDAGKLKIDGRVDEAVAAYLSDDGSSEWDGVIPDSAPRKAGTGEALLRRVELRDPSGRRSRRLFRGQRFTVTALYDVRSPVQGTVMELGISTLDGLRVATATSIDAGVPLMSLQPGSWEIEVEMDVTLVAGQYAVDVFLHDADRPITIDWVERTLIFEALDLSEGADREDHHLLSPERGFPRRGFVCPPASWHGPRRTS